MSGAALIKKYTGTDISNYDIQHTAPPGHDGVAGDSASVSVATAASSPASYGDTSGISSVGNLHGSLSIAGDAFAQVEFHIRPRRSQRQA